MENDAMIERSGKLQANFNALQEKTKTLEETNRKLEQSLSAVHESHAALPGLSVRVS